MYIQFSRINVYTKFLKGVFWMTYWFGKKINKVSKSYRMCPMILNMIAELKEKEKHNHWGKLSDADIIETAVRDYYYDRVKSQSKE
jgi:hypothetical protein